MVAPGTSRSGRSLVERSETTTTELLAAASDLFATRGFSGTSIEDIVRGAGVTRGALYHHFRSKSEVFRAVYVAEQQRLAEHLSQHVAEIRGSWERLRAGCQGFLTEALDPRVRQIVLLDAPSVLGWEATRQVEAQNSGFLLRAGLQEAEDDGFLRPGDVEFRTAMLTGALCDAAILVATSPDRHAALDRATRELDLLLAGFRAPDSVDGR